MAKDLDYYLELMKNKVSGLDTSEGSVVDGILRAAAYGFAAAQYELQGFAQIAFPEDGSGAYLDARAADVGMERKPGAKATATVTFTGEENTVIPAGTAVQTVDGLIYLTTAEVTIGNDGTADVTVEAEAVGTIYNVTGGRICVMQTALPLIIDGGAASGGADPETDSALLARLQAYLRATPASGNEAQYLDWATSVPGVGFARVIPRPNGDAYAVKLILVDEEMQPVSQTVADAVEAYLETVREVCIETSAIPATAKAVSVTATLTLATGTSLSAVRDQFIAMLTSYFEQLVRTGGNVVANRVSAMLMSIDGVENYAGFSCGPTSIGTTEVPVVGTITLEEASSP